MLALVWQLMRAYVTQFLAQLGLGEADVLRWANCQLRRCDAMATPAGAAPAAKATSLSIGSFADPALRSGVALLRVLHAVAPECVDLCQALPGEGAQEAMLNAKYVISCAHKMGCSHFTAWEDVVELRPKMVMCLLAAAMAEDMRRHLAAAPQPNE